MMLRAVLAALVLGTASAPAAGQGAAMEPFKMVRSLQLVQDRLARGDHAALPMQRKLLELTDERFRTVTKEEFTDRRNFTALMVYAMSGGNPDTLDIVLSRLVPEGSDRSLGLGVLAYMRGQLPKAAEELAALDPMSLEPEVGAYLALVKGSIIALRQPGTAVGFMDQARLLAPGTLVEEAALRRSLPASIALDQPDRFMTTVERYVRRFLASPYASEFADAFVEGLVTFGDRIDAERIDGIVSLMRPAQQEAIYLRLARRSTIKGQVQRSAFASQKAREVARIAHSPEDPRATLYAALASITAENAREVVASLEKVDPSKLSPRDRRLFLAARAIADEMLSPPAPLPAVAEIDATSANADEDEIPAERTAEMSAPEAENPQEATKSAEKQIADMIENGGTATSNGRSAGPPDEGASRNAALVSSVRGKLDAIDKMLEAADERELK